MKPRVLLLDIETAPNAAWVWGLFDQNISASQVEASGYVLCWSAKWLGEKTLRFARVGKNRAGEREMLAKIHALLDEADIVVHYNGRKFDIPTLNREFIKFGMAPPSPYKQVDLLQVAKRAFRFESNKLDYVSQALGIGQKVKHKGFELWIACMRGDAKAWAQMERYNRQDVALLERLYRRLRPWIEKHPNLGAHGEGLCCPKCGSEKVQKRGEQVAQLHRYTRYQCQVCGGWFRGNKSRSARGVERGVNIVG
jgi:DNA polymerase elongation subunit (family B)